MLILLILALSLTIGGTLATWDYANGEATHSFTHLSLNIFPWEGSDVLPDDNQLGENHRMLIENILNGKKTNSNGSVTELGLNSPDSYINNEIEDRSNAGWFSSSDTLGSMDFWESSDINNYFNTNTANVSFILYFPDGVSDTYYLYTTSEELGDTGNPVTPIGKPIYPIYQTVLQKNSEGHYEAVSTKVGYANSAWYDNRITGSWLQYPSFDPETWREGEP